MNRLIFYLLLLSVVGCAQVHPDNPDNPDKEQPEPEVDYGFHDEYYYTYGQKETLTPCSDEYVIAFSSNSKDQVIDYIESCGFAYILDYPIEYKSALNVEHDIPNYMQSYMLIWLKGKADNVKLIPNVFFSDIVYRHPHESDEYRILTTNRLVVTFDENATDENLALAMDYAVKFKIEPVYSVKNNIWFACTDESAGNAIEIANWFCENGFPNSQPEFFEPNAWD